MESTQSKVQEQGEKDELEVVEVTEEDSIMDRSVKHDTIINDTRYSVSDYYKTYKTASI